MEFTIYRWDRKTNIGEIVRSGRCPEWAVGHQPNSGESVLVGQALDDVHHYIQLETVLVNGEHVVTGPGKTVCTYSDEEVARRISPGDVSPLLAKRVAAALAAKGVNPALAQRLAQRRQDLAASAQERA